MKDNDSYKNERKVVKNNNDAWRSCSRYQIQTHDNVAAITMNRFTDSKQETIHEETDKDGFR